MTIKKTNAPNFVTYGDSSYFPTVYLNLKSITKNYPKSKIYIGDVGFTKEQIKKINSFENASLIEWDKLPDLEKYFETPKRRFFELLFKLKKVKYLRGLLNRLFPREGIKNKVYRHLMFAKPLLILKSVVLSSDSPMIFIDGDAILINKIDETLMEGYDVGVTVRSKEDQRKYEQLLGDYGKVNSGVIVFNCDNKTKIDFLTDWTGKMMIENINRKSLSEQISLNKLVYGKYAYKSGLKFKELDGEIYNYQKVEKYLGLETKKIIHLKGSDRRNNLKIMNKIREYIENGNK